MTDGFFTRLAIGCAVATLTLAASAASEPAAIKPAAAASAAAAAAPATAAPTPGTAAATPAAAPTAPAAAVGEVETAVRAWASAWSAKDVDRYLAAYTTDFKPSGKQTHAAWADQRRKRIAGKDSISVSVDDLVVSVHGKLAAARFKQTYKAGKLNETAPKTLELQQVGAQWLIAKEHAGS